MNTIYETETFSNWLAKLKDRQGKARILARIASAKAGNFGDCEPIGEGVSEMRIHFGPGYRLYFAQEDKRVYLLIIGGDKSEQKRNIGDAKIMWRAIKGEGS